jgi:hypothetical protein
MVVAGYRGACKAGVLGQPDSLITCFMGEDSGRNISILAKQAQGLWQEAIRYLPKSSSKQVYGSQFLCFVPLVIPFSKCLALEKRLQGY